ncbi:DUF4386 domain-containing protein [Ostreiculturibacter nitratireducens]|uniref:DUF4386 domain-containing protein n=1 Tax=Ostreiculturibacter nitratireducens TaxID=3075226 RepID=UPI0031B5D2E2
MAMTDTRPTPNLARVAGALYLVIIVAGVWSEGFARASLVVPGDASATAANIRAATGLFQASFAADILMTVSDAALAILLFLVFRPVSETLAFLAAAFRLIQTAILGANLMNQHEALLILDAPTSAFAPGQQDALALLSLQAQSHGYDLGLVFFGINCLVTGVLIYRSGFLPRAIGLAIAASGPVYLTGSVLTFLAPAASGAFAPAYALPLLAESAFCLWLLLRARNLGPRAA